MPSVVVELEVKIGERVLIKSKQKIPIPALPIIPPISLPSAPKIPELPKLPALPVFQIPDLGSLIPTVEIKASVE